MRSHRRRTGPVWVAACLLASAGAAGAAGTKPASNPPPTSVVTAVLSAPTPAATPADVTVTARTTGGTQDLAAAQKQLADLTAEFTLRVAGAGPEGRDLLAHGRAWLGSGRRYRVEYDRPEAQVLVSDGKRRWLYLKKIAQVQVQPLPPAGNANELFLELGGGLPALLGRCRVDRLADDGDLQGFALTPRADSGLGFTRARIWAAGPRLLPRRVEVEAGRRVTVEFAGVAAHTRSEVARDPKLAVPAERFRFTPPPDAEVVEPLVAAP